MKFTLKQIMIFDAITAEQSVSIAAKKLSMTQSAVSMSLSQLENLLARPLFIRHGNRLLLSPWGRWLRPHARRLLQNAEQIEQGLYQQHLLSGFLAISASQTIAEHLMPELISRIDQNFPELRLDLTVNNTDKVIKSLINHESDLGIIEGRCDDARIIQRTWMSDKLVIIASSEHPYASLSTISNIQLQQANWVLREQGAGTRCVFDAAISKHLSKINVYKEYSQVNVLKALVKQGHYLSALPYLDVKQEVQSGQLAILTSSLQLERHLSFVWHKDVGSNPLRDYVIEQADAMTHVE